MPTQTRTNAHPAACATCRNQVPAGAGSLTRENNRWVVRHLAACPAAAAPAAVVQVTAITATNVPAGHYAIPTVTGQNDLSFYRVDRPTEGTWAGRVFVKVMIGGRAAHAVRGAAAAAILVRIEALGIQAAAQRYGQEIGRCGRCNRSLTDAVSRACGIGPDCRQMEGWLITTAEANAIYAAARKRAGVAPHGDCRVCEGGHDQGLCPVDNADAFMAAVRAGLNARQPAYA